MTASKCNQALQPQLKNYSMTWLTCFNEVVCVLPVTSDSSPVQGLPPSGCAGLRELGRCFCLCVSVCLQTTPRPKRLSLAMDTQE